MTKEGKIEDIESKTADVKSLYIHIPFCEKRCFYCSFYSIVADDSTMSEYIDAIERELSIYANGIKPETIFIGGGTPTALNNNNLEKLFVKIKKFVNFSSLKEFSVEANPNSLTQEKIRMFENFGVNRLSIGIQSFNEEKLRFLGRVHSVKESLRAIDLVQSSNIKNFNLDLIFGIPGETISLWKNDIEEALKYSPAHIAAYSLSYDEGTPLTKLYQKGKIKKIDDETELTMFLTTIEILKSNEYEHYEVSNYAKKGFKCLHNIKYWQNEEYTGIGASAVSYTKGVRRQNVSDAKAYIRTLLRNEPIKNLNATSEKLVGEKRARETLILALRMREGVNKIKFKEKTGFDLERLVGVESQKFKRLGLIEEDENKFRVSEKGLAVLNSIFEEFV